MRAETVATGPAASKWPGRWAALSVLCVSLLITSLDNTVLNVALPTLVRRLHASDSDLQWVVDAYVLAFAGLMLVSGSLADRVGRKLTFLAGLVLFAGCSAWAAFSGSVGHLIAARTSMGVGAALIMPSTLAIITNVFTDARERQRAIGFWAATSGAGIALGPIVGGLLLTHFWWGSVFLINVPIAAAGFALATRLVPNSKNPEARPPDLVGSALSIAGLGLLLYSIIEAPVHGWSSPVVLGTGIGGVAVLVGFVFWERASTHPMLNLAFFRDRRFAAPIVSVSTMMFGLFGALFVLTQYLQFQLGFTALQAGVRMLPTAGAIAVVAPLADRLVRALGVRLTIAAGALAAAAGLWQTSGATVSTSYGGVVLGMALVGVGAGMVIPSATASVMGSLPPEHTGVGAATNGTFLQTGGALGVAVIGSLLANRYDDRVKASLAPYHVPRAAEQAIAGSLGAALAVAHQIGGAAGAVVAGAARSAFVAAMDLGLAVAAAVVLAAAVIGVATLPGRVRRRRPSHGDRSGREPGREGGATARFRARGAGAVLVLLVASVVPGSGGGGAAAAAPPPGYWLEAGDGGVFSLGLPFHGSAASDPARCPANPPGRSMPDGSCWSMAATPGGGGYWLLNAYSGSVFTFGDAVSYGQPADTGAYGGGADLWPTAIGIVATPDGKGYWVLEVGPSGLGSVQGFGDARYFGDEVTVARATGHAGAPVAMAATPDGGGYWIVDTDGGVFAFGDARFYGSMGGRHLAAPVVGMARSTDGAGYWLAAADGGVFAFGGAPFGGSMAGRGLVRPVVGMAPDPAGPGYWLVAGDGGVFALGGAPFLGSAAGTALDRPVFAIAAAWSGVHTA